MSVVYKELPFTAEELENILTTAQNLVNGGTGTTGIKEVLGISAIEAEIGLGASSDSVLPDSVTPVTPPIKTRLETLEKYNNNIKNSEVEGGLNQRQDLKGITTEGYFDFTGKNANATALDSTLIEEIPYGATGAYAASFGGKSAAIGKRSLAEGTTTIAKGNYSHAEGDNSVALGDDSHAEGYKTVSAGIGSHSEGHNTQAIGAYSHVEGSESTASGDASHAEGGQTRAEGIYSHAEGAATWAEGKASHTEGEYTHAAALQAHAEGYGTKAHGVASHAEGNGTIASHENSHAGGQGTQTSRENQTVIGEYNTDNSDALLIVGNGSSSNSKTNAFTVLKDGRATIGKDPSNKMDVATKQYVDTTIANLINSAPETLDTLGEIADFLGSSDSENTLTVMGKINALETTTSEIEESITDLETTTTEYIDNSIDALIDGAPNNLNTLHKLANKLTNDLKNLTTVQLNIWGEDD